MMVPKKRTVKLLLAVACTIIPIKTLAFAPRAAFRCFKKSSPSCKPPNAAVTASTTTTSSSLHLSAIDRGYDTPINIEETAPRDMTSFEEWAYNYGIQRAEGFQLAYNADGTDIYAMTNQDMATGSCVLYVPEHCILSSTKAMAELRTHDMDQAEKILFSVNAESELRQYYLMVKVCSPISKRSR